MSVVIQILINSALNCWNIYIIIEQFVYSQKNVFPILSKLI